jgi:GAF domain-containing protein
MDELKQELSHGLEAAAKAGAGQREAVLAALVPIIAKALALHPDELAVLMVTPDRRMLRFVYPPDLADGSNLFPLTVPSLAGRVAQTGRSVVVNTAQDVPHLDFYERIRIKDAKPRRIQKLLAVGIRGPEGKVRAVIEASRRGDSPGEAGPDFRPEDQQLLEGLAAAAGPAVAAAFAWKP